MVDIPEGRDYHGEPQPVLVAGGRGGVLEWFGLWVGRSFHTTTVKHWWTYRRDGDYHGEKRKGNGALLGQACGVGQAGTHTQPQIGRAW